MNGGAGILLAISPIHSFSLNLGCGRNKNTRAEFLALWVFLYFVVVIGLPYLHIYGDSSVVINWEKNKPTLSALDMVYWCHNIYKLKESFYILDFQHVYREHNMREDCLSKEALSMASGLCSFM